MVLWRLNMLLQCYSRAELHGRVRGRFFLFFLAQVRTRRPISASIPHFNWGGRSTQNAASLHPPPRSPGNLGSAPTSCRTDAFVLVCVRAGERACVSVFLWLCWRPCSGCGATVATDPTRCVLSASPAPPPGPGSASNPEATSAAICGQIAQTD